MLILHENTLALRIAETLKACCAYETPSGAAKDGGFSFGTAALERNCALADLADAECQTLDAVAQRCGARFADHDLANLGSIVLEKKWPTTKNAAVAHRPLTAVR